LTVAAIPAPAQHTVEAIFRWWKDRADNGHRPHLGASLIGHPCDRFLWMTFRWVASEKFPGRVLRMFDSGKREEPRVYGELRGIGYEVWSDDGTAQFRCSALGDHFGGALDGVLRGLIEAPKTPHVLEIKTHNQKSFDDLMKRGVKGSKPMHYAQMQTYMHLMGLERALYFAVCKNDDSIYTERVEYDQAEARRIVERASRIISSWEPPAKIASDAEGQECKWCKFKDACHGTQAPEVNCRTCAHSTPVVEGEGGQWTCNARATQPVPITIQIQRNGCEKHLFIPPLLENLGTPIDGGENFVAYRRADGGEFFNGPPPGYSSAEIAAGAAAPQMLTDPLVKDLKAQFPGAKLVGARALTEMPNDLEEAPVKAARKKKVAA
jgi:CRISPR/Cas system-associated exonuclease Cas4 (RecB family)